MRRRVAVVHANLPDATSLGINARPKSCLDEKGHKLTPAPNGSLSERLITRGKGDKGGGHASHPIVRRLEFAPKHAIENGGKQGINLGECFDLSAFKFVSFGLQTV